MQDQFITIDSEHTRDIDDAIFLERFQDGYRIVVAIANAADIVRIGSTEDIAASKIAATAYAGQRIIHRMLPASISENMASLIEGKKRSAIVSEILLSENLDIIQFTPSIRNIEVFARLSHSDFVRIISDKEDNLHEMLALAAGIGSLLLAKRRKVGALALYDLTRLLVTDEDGNLLQMKSKEEAIAYILVQETMILANKLTAQYFAEHDIPGIYRNHEPRSAAPVASELASTIDSWVQAGSFSQSLIKEHLGLISTKSKYESVCKGHYALSLAAYMHTTSPIRRYPDLINQRQLIAHLKGKPLAYDKEALNAISDAINLAIDRRKVEREDGFKNVLKRFATHAIESDNLETLADHELVAALKVGRDAGYLPDVLVAEVVRRINNDEITDKVIASLITDVPSSFLSKELIEPLCKWISKHMNKVPGFLNHGARTHIFNNILFVDSQNDDKAFFVSGEMVSNGIKFTSTGTGAKKRDAEQHAAAQLLCQFFGGVYTSKETVSPLSSENFKGKLIELCAKRKWAQPTFNCNGKGPSHSMEFSCNATLKVGTDVIESTIVGARSKREAENAVSARLLEQIPIDRDPTVPEISNASGNHVGQLLEFCQKKKLPPPDFIFSEINSDSIKFRCVITVATSPSIQKWGEGLTKKSAKQDGASKVLAALGSA